MPPYETFRVFRTLTITEYIDIQAKSEKDAERAVELLLESGETLDWSLIGDETDVKILYGATSSVGGCTCGVDYNNYVSGLVDLKDSGMIDLDSILESINKMSVLNHNSKF